MSPDRKPALQPPVLIMEENQRFADTVREILEVEFGLSDQDVLEASNVRLGADILNTGQIGSLITALRFSDGEVTGLIEQLPEPRIAIWIITGQMDPQTEKYCREVLKVIDYLQKPVDEETLIASLKKEI